MPAPALFHWLVQVDELPANTAYAYRVDDAGGDADTVRSGNRFNGSKVLIDPYIRGNVDTPWEVQTRGSRLKTFHI